MNETLYIDAVLYGWFAIAFIFFLFATFVRDRDRVRAICLICAFLALVCQAGCFKILGGIGTATGGSDEGADKMMTPVWVAFVLAFIWCFLLISRPKK
jgi:hypothetical protein